MSVVLDSSAVLAFVHSEPGAEFVADALGDAVMSTVNWAEVVSRVRGDATNGGGGGPSDLRFELCALGLRLEEFSAEQADLAGELRRSTREFGLSLGDRACLALALVRSEPVLTADRVWQRLSLDVELEVIR
ncbi:MAG: type II toxin-antitoxin system VapC family toxin [Acidobacteria bacterium]|nr:type II toxin-antitoxin system VapC family toxin [Acidobacteriota bacterium]